MATEDKPKILTEEVKNLFTPTFDAVSEIDFENMYMPMGAYDKYRQIVDAVDNLKDAAGKLEVELTKLGFKFNEDKY